MGREMCDEGLLVEHQALRGPHVIDARPCRRLEHALREGVGHKTLDLFGTLSLCAQLRHLQHAWKVRAGALRIHALWLLSRRQRMLDDGCEAVLAIPDLDVAGRVEDVDRRLARY